MSATVGTSVSCLGVVKGWDRFVGWRGSSFFWTGEEMIVWAGQREDGLAPLGDGAAYNPRSNTWRELPDGPLEDRFGHTAVWTGTEMLVYGGFARSEFADGAAYDPASNAWRKIRPWKARWLHTAVWTGEEMIV